MADIFHEKYKCMKGFGIFHKKIHNLSHSNMIMADVWTKERASWECAAEVNKHSMMVLVVPMVVRGLMIVTSHNMGNEEEYVVRMSHVMVM